MEKKIKDLNFECYLLIFDNGVSKRKQYYSSFNRASEGMKYKYGNLHTKIYGISIDKKIELNAFGFPESEVEVDE